MKSGVKRQWSPAKLMDAVVKQMYSILPHQGFSDMEKVWCEEHGEQDFSLISDLLETCKPNELLGIGTRVRLSFMNGDAAGVDVWCELVIQEETDRQTSGNTVLWLFNATWGEDCTLKKQGQILADA